MFVMAITCSLHLGSPRLGLGYYLARTSLDWILGPAERSRQLQTSHLLQWKYFSPEFRIVTRRYTCRIVEPHSFALPLQRVPVARINTYVPAFWISPTSEPGVIANGFDKASLGAVKEAVDRWSYS